MAETDDGDLAAFAATRCDELNRTGLLEAVGTHPDHQQRGLGRAAVRFAAHHMAAAGMEHAIVANIASNWSGSTYSRRGLDLITVVGRDLA
jgi:N-acetylglutamate synthase-like GNAT family acetyltransferase